MGEKFIRHLVAVATTLVCILAYYAGYYSGGHGFRNSNNFYVPGYLCPQPCYVLLNNHVLKIK